MQELIKEIKRGEKEAFKTLYNQYAEYAIRVATAVTRNRMHAADAVQETFIRIYNNIDSFDESKSFEPWLYKILINECNRILKKQPKTIPIDDYLDTHLSLPLQEDSYKFQEYEELYNAINTLEDINRIPIVLKYLKGFTEKEIAEALDLNNNTVKSRLYKGREKLKKYMVQILEGRNEYDKKI